MAFYKVIMNYPSGKVEEIEDSFPSLDAARNFGEQLKGQVLANSRFIDDEEELKEPYFIVVKREDGKNSIAFDSRF